MKKKIIYLILVILLVLVVILVFNKKIINSIYSKKQISTNNTQNNIKDNTSKSKFTPSLAELSILETESIDKSDWQTYKNDNYSFEIKGPKSWNIKLNNKLGLLGNTDPNDHAGNYLFFQPSLNDYKLNGYVPFELGAQDNPENLSITDWMLKTDPVNNSRWQEGYIKLEIPTAEEAVAFYVSNSYGEGTYNYYIKKNKKMFSFQWMDINPDGMKNSSAMMNAIVKTLMFK